ncbi:hypothetical protein BDB00DRAFT_349617 [Zychaea mexicana]|uniref:uncharacterized protein n=1 Tax=Zychaea mexicana TaxID=64656 RepID=UPI0022FE1FC5|nr:uncharacterized protein BDB00DRAFT_349617 [Zychaea mexicana]KAI9493889.1 hypothetical protein BDB00DRAFT_349617 [Zychaea mexicana]
MPVDSDMEDSISSHHEPASPLSMSSPFAGSLDATGAFLSHSLPNYHHPHQQQQQQHPHHHQIPVHGQNGGNAGMLPQHLNSMSTTTATQARPSSLYMNRTSATTPTATDTGATPPSSFSPRLSVPQVNNPGAMSFEELLSMYYAGGAGAGGGGSPAVDTPPATSASFDGNMLSSLMASQGADGSLSHIDPSQLVSGNDSATSSSSSGPFGIASGELYLL